MCDFTAQIGGGLPWLSAAPLMGTLAAGESMNVTVTFNSTGLAAGDYFGDILFTSDDPNNLEKNVDVTLHVGEPGGDPEIVVNPDEFYFELPVSQLETQIMEVHNMGGGMLDYSLTIEYDGMDAAGTPVPQERPANFNISNCEVAPGSYAGPVQYTDDPFDLQFEYACADATGEAGIESDGTYIYTTLWNGTQFVKYDLQGNYVETFACGSAAALRDLAYDGMYFYGGAAATTIFEMDFTNKVLVSTFTAPVASRAIAYDPIQDGFWANNWSTAPTLFDRGGATLNSFAIGGDESFYGFAFMHNDEGTGLWGYSQKVGTSQNMLYLYDVDNGTILNEFDMLSILSLPTAGTDIAGGLYMQENMIPGTWTLGGIVQNICIWGVEMGAAEGPVYWLSVEPTSGSVAGGGMDEVDVICNTNGFADIVYYYATIMVASNDPDMPMVEVPVTLGLVGINNDIYQDAYIMMYPNPAKNLVNISTNYELSTVTIINQLGQVVYNQQVTGSAVQVNTSQLQKGIYFVKVNSVAGESTQKLIIQ
jgi:hypothetical protein